MTDRTLLTAPLSDAEEREFVPVLHELISVAFKAVQPYFLSAPEVALKLDASPVTAADRAAETAMRERLDARYPTHALLGEEFGERPGSGYRWVLDPIDGTRAFISNCFLFGTLIALERDDGAGFVPVLGCIAHPAAGFALVGQRERTTLYAADGRRRPAQVRACSSIDKATVLASSHWESGEQGPAEGAGRVARRAGMYRTWGDCFGYFAVATGGADLMLDPKLSYWDVAAIVPVIEGAGGRVSSFGGGNPLRDLSLVASAGGVHDEALALIADRR